MGWPGLPEILIILLIVVIFFGVGKLPELGSGLGEGIRNFKKSFKGGDDENDKIGSKEGKPALDDKTEKKEKPTE